MKKLFLAVCVVLSFPVLAQAQSNTTMRSLTVDQLYQYGQATYERGDYTQAAAVFTKILSLSPQHMEAIKYAVDLRKKGQLVIIPVGAENLQGSAKVMKPAETPAAAVNTDGTIDNQDLKKDVQETDQAIDTLRQEVVILRAQIAKGQQDLANSKIENTTK
jgi:hypothetical protein